MKVGWGYRQRVGERGSVQVRNGRTRVGYRVTKRATVTAGRSGMGLGLRILKGLTVWLRP